MLKRMFSSSLRVMHNDDLVKNVLKNLDGHTSKASNLETLATSINTLLHSDNKKIKSASFEESVDKLFSTPYAYTHIVSIHAGRNNTICTLSDKNGNSKFSTSGGSVGLKKAARGTTDAGYQSANFLTEKASKVGIVPESVHIKIKGFGPGRDQAFKAIIAAGWKVVRITDVTPIRFAGCRPKKKRRL